MLLSSPRSPVAAATLSFIFPGLGEIALGARRRGLVLAVPALAVVLGGVAIAAAAFLDGGQTGLLALLLRPDVILAIVAIDLLALGYHLAAILDAWLLALRPGGTRRTAGAVAVAGLAVLLAGTGLAHGAVATLGLRTEDALSAVFPDDPDGEWVIPEPSFEPEETAPPGPFTPTAAPTQVPASPGGTGSSAPTVPPTPAQSRVPRWAQDGRLDVLLVGSDAGEGRWLLRTDTMIVLSVDVETGHAALFGIPRNLVNVPLPPESAAAFVDGRFPHLLNALYVYAWGHPDAFPGGDARGFRAVTGAVQELVGVRLDAFVAADLRGFVRLVDSLGGLWIDVPERLVDHRYPKVNDTGTIEIDIRAGCQELDGAMALAYARSRHQDSDYGRMRRQQRVLVALRDQLDPAALVTRVPELLGILEDHLWTNVKRSQIAGLAALASRVNAEDVRRKVFVPPGYPSHLTSGELREIRREVRHLFDDWRPEAGVPTPSLNADGCP